MHRAFYGVILNVRGSYAVSCTGTDMVAKQLAAATIVLNAAPMPAWQSLLGPSRLIMCTDLGVEDMIMIVYVVSPSVIASNQP